MRPLRLQGCVALVTGASSGIGAELARQLAPLATKLLLVARRRDRLEALARELAREGLTVEVIEVDLGDAAAVERLAERAVHEGVDLLVNNAGLGDLSMLEHASWPKLEQLLAVNIRALTRLCHAVVPTMVARQRGGILNVSSTAGFQPIPRFATYAASKSFVNLFSEALRAELRGTGVGVTALCPGPVDTEFQQVAGGRSLGATPRFAFETPAAVARAGLRALAEDRARVVPGVLMSLLISISETVPAWVFRVIFSVGRGLFQAPRRPGGTR